MGNSMEAWNGSQMCAIDCETTGLEAGWHEIIQISILPLTSALEPRQDVLPFSVYMKPDNPERVEPEAMKVNKKNLAEVMLKGFDSGKTHDLLLEWVEKLGLPYNKYGNRKKIIPLGHNYQFDRAFIVDWLGPATYENVFEWQFRDTMRTALYLNDRACSHGERIPYPKVDLQYLASCLKVETTGSHDALSDCLTTAKVYKKLVGQGLLG